MKSLAVHTLLRNRVLVTRESARRMAPTLFSVIQESKGRLRLDFEGIEGITPSFLDELMGVIEDGLNRIDQKVFYVEIRNSPTRLSPKFAAIGRGRGVMIKESDGATWIIEREKRGVGGASLS